MNKLQKQILNLRDSLYYGGISLETLKKIRSLRLNLYLFNFYAKQIHHPPHHTLLNHSKFFYWVCFWEGTNNNKDRETPTVPPSLTLIPWKYS